MSFLGLTFERRYPVFGMFGDIRAMTAAEILKMQFEQARAMQNAYVPHSLSYLNALVGYPPVPQRPLDERFSDFKVRLAAARAKHGMAA